MHLLVLAVGIHVHAPAQLATWEHAAAKVVIENQSGKPIVPLAIEIESIAGTVTAWGSKSQCRGNVDGCSIQTGVWAMPAPARQHNGRWELLLGQPPPQQFVAPPDPLTSQVTTQLIRLDPMAPGETLELETSFVAAYQHGGAFHVTLRYVEVDSKLATCTPASRPTQPAFVACNAATSGELYATETALVAAAREITDKRSFVVAHPAFDVDAARKLAKLATGDFGYERSTKAWILVDDTRARTVLIGERGLLQDLPGDWLRLLLTLDGTNETTIFWNAINEWDASRILAQVTQARISIKGFAFKGRSDPTRFMVTVSRKDIATLASAIRNLGYRMTAHGITK